MAVKVALKVGAMPVLRVGSSAVTVYPEGDVFHGPYKVAPTLTGLDLETKDLFMTNDLKVDPIPISEVTNESHGYTVTIG